MARLKEKGNLAVPRERTGLADRPGWTPEEIANYIRYQLSELGGTNGHHDFERLCFYLARERIYPNLIPSTGPVSAGGDQGSDFETYEVAPDGQSAFFARASDDKVVFACSIEKNFKRKIKADLDLIAKAQPSVRHVRFFSSGSIPVAIRHKVQEYAKGAHGIELEIFDSLAISALLADQEVFWIATRFLSIPGDVFLATTQKDPSYEEALNTVIDEDHLTPAVFTKIKNAARRATFDSERHSDLPKLIANLRAFRGGDGRLARKSVYEEFVASLRGLKFIDDCAGDLPEYFAAVPQLTDTAEIEDAVVLVHYAFGAQFRGLLKLRIEELLAWWRSLLARIEELLRDGAISPGRRSSLLDMKAFLALLSWLEHEGKASEEDAAALMAISAEAAFAIWRKMMKFVRQSPMFPLEAFARRIAILAPRYAEVNGYAALSEETDKLLAARAGQQKLAEQAYERAKAYSDSGQLLEAIDQLHIAHISSFTRETAINTVYMPLFLAKMYSAAGLYAAAKYYALASSFAALKIDDEDLRSYVYRGLAEAAASDHANGASLSFFLALKATMLVAYHFSASGSEEVKDFEWARLYFYAFILVYGSSLVSQSLNRYLSSDLLPKLGLKDRYDEALPEVRRFFETRKSYAELASEAMEEEIAPPFGDAPRVRKLSWAQLGMEWTVEWENDYDTTAVAEGFVALLQIFLTDLRKIELSLLPSRVQLTIERHSGDLQIEEIPSNSEVVRKIRLPEKIAPDLVLGVAGSILTMVSAWPHEKFLKIIEARMKLGLAKKTNPHAPYHILFWEFYSKEDYEHLHGLVLETPPTIPSFTIGTSELLKGPSGVHPEYDPAESRRLVANRYKNTLRQLKFTLPRLLEGDGFRSTIAGLRSQGWKDWHILLSMANIRFNFLVDHTADIEEYKKAASQIMDRDETESDPRVPAELFTIEKLRFGLRMSQLSTLKGLGFHCWQPTPVHEAVDRFLARFNYWSDDVAHEDPFKFPVPA